MSNLQVGKVRQEARISSLQKYADVQIDPCGDDNDCLNSFKTLPFTVGFI